jgi:hypothetical protein
MEITQQKFTIVYFTEQIELQNEPPNKNSQSFSSSNKYRITERVFRDHHSAYSWQLTQLQRTVLYNFLQRDLEIWNRIYSRKMHEGMRMHARSKQTEVYDSYENFPFFSHSSMLLKMNISN